MRKRLVQQNPQHQPETAVSSGRPAFVASLGLLVLCGLSVGLAIGQAEPELASATVFDLDLDLGRLGTPRVARQRHADNLAAACDTCHVVDPTFSHPVDFYPDKSIPEHLPLFDGRMTCLTCHQAPDGDTHAFAAARGQPLLRGPGPGPMFCVQCHAKDEDDRFTGHGTAVSRAHLRWPGDWRGGDQEDAGRADTERADTFEPASHGAAQLSRRNAGNGLRLDTESRACLACHDGASAQGIGHSHPLGVKHDPMRYARDGGGRRLAWAGSLDRRIRLFDGHIGCGSCHNPYSPERKLMAVANDHGQLCINCHQGY